MVVVIVEFKDGKLNDKARKEAVRTLSNALTNSKKTKILTQSDFISFKRVLELYLKKLKLVVKFPKPKDETPESTVGVQVQIPDPPREGSAQGDDTSQAARGTQSQLANDDQNENEDNPELVLEVFRDDVQIDNRSAAEPPVTYVYEDLSIYCRRKQRQPIDLLVDEMDPKNLPTDLYAKNTHYMKLSPEVDDIVSDDILQLNPIDMNYLCSITGDFRTGQIVRHLGRSYYLALEARRQRVYRKMLSLSWPPGESVLEFNHKVQLNISECTELGLHCNVIDQVITVYCSPQLAH